MSSYVVKDITINRIVTFLYYEKDCFLRPDLDRLFQKIKINLDEEGCKELALKMIALNVEAVNQRYDEKDTNSVKEFIFNLDVPLKDRKIEQVFNSLRCLTYQMHEGDVPETELYKILEELQEKLAYYIATKRTEELKCTWD